MPVLHIAYGLLVLAYVCTRHSWYWHVPCVPYLTAIPVRTPSAMSGTDIVYAATSLAPSEPSARSATLSVNVMSGTDTAYCGIGLRVCYATFSTELAHEAICLCDVRVCAVRYSHHLSSCYAHVQYRCSAMSGTDLAHAATRCPDGSGIVSKAVGAVWRVARALWSFARPTPFPVLRSRMLLPGGCGARGVCARELPPRYPIMLRACPRIVLCARYAMSGTYAVYRAARAYESEHEFDRRFPPGQYALRDVQ
eukprot:3375935-Rhodomonas_salina.12